MDATYFSMAGLKPLGKLLSSMNFFLTSSQVTFMISAERSTFAK